MISEIELHLYLLNKTLLDTKIKNEIEKQLETDQSLRSEFEEIKEFYNNFEQIEIEKIPKTYLLTPLVQQPNKLENIVLAAQQSLAVESKLQYVKTFVSAEKYVMVRMFHNSILKEYEFYVICEENENAKNACIKIPSLNMEIFTDENGCAKIYTENIPEDVELTVTLK